MGSTSVDRILLQSEQALLLARASRCSACAEECALLRQLEETEVLRDVIHSRSFHNRGREAYQALVIACAVRKTLAAERQFASECLNEAETVLQVFRNAAETAEVRLRMADRQLVSVLEEMDAEGISSFTSLQPENYVFTPRLHQPDRCLCPESSDYCCTDSDDSDIDEDD